MEIQFELITALFWVIMQRVVVIPYDVSEEPIGPDFKGQESKKVTQI